MLGADWSHGRGTIGLLLAHSRGEGDYRSPGGNGEVGSTVTGLYPYGRLQVRGTRSSMSPSSLNSRRG